MYHQCCAELAIMENVSYRRLAEALLRGQPYFGVAMRALQGPPERQRYFLPVVKAAAQDSAEILEVGSWAGASAISWASALQRLKLPGHVTCVDPWVPYFDPQRDPAGHYRHMNQAASHGMIRKLFDHNVFTSGFSGTILAKAGRSCDVLPRLDAHSFDIVYLDGSHVFEDVLFDLQQAKRLVRSGGIICGDDLEIQLSDLDAAEVEVAAERRQDYVWSSVRSGSYHPGVTLAVGLEFGRVSEWEGFWAVRYSDAGPLPLTLNLIESMLPEHLSPFAFRIEEETPAYYILTSGDRCFALAKQLGPPDLGAELLVDEDFPPLILTAASLEAVRERVQQHETAHSSNATEPVEKYPIPYVVDSHRGFNLVCLNDQVFGLRRTLGPVDVGPGGRSAWAQFSPQDAILGKSLEEVKARIDAVEAELAIHDLTGHLQALMRSQNKE